MNVQNLKRNYPKLITYMEGEGYSKDYIGRLAREINRILENAGSAKWSCYADVYMEYEVSQRAASYLNNKRSVIGIIEQFDIYGRYPGGSHRSALLGRGAYSLLVPAFKEVIDCHRKVEKERRKKDSTIRVEANNSATFLLSLQRQGIDGLEKITEEAVIEVFLSPDGHLLKSHSYRKKVAAVFSACLLKYPKATKVLAFLPSLRASRKNIQYLTPEEIGKVKNALNSSDALCLRDRAIGVMALYTGLRRCDIAGLELDSFDWVNDLIRISQQKTNVPLELPLSAVIGNVVYDYLKLERPRIDCKYLFISKRRPYNQIKSVSLGNVAAKIMKAAGIRQSAGERKGLHIFRHHLATALLENGVPQAVISKTLGHNSPNSLEPYLSADFLHLKECAISIEAFPVPKEVFLHG